MASAVLYFFLLIREMCQWVTQDLCSPLLVYVCSVMIDSVDTFQGFEGQFDYQVFWGRP